MLAGKKLAVLGVGKLGEALVSGLLSETVINQSDVIGTVKHEKSLDRVRQRLPIQVTTNKALAVQGQDVVILAVKPQNMESLLRDIGPALKTNQLLISVVTSITTTYIEERLPRPIPVIRA